eukprot:GHVS01045050.1.p1 GENE.GHVS01045050.1~~GHVS01045050.1.p1  ORF type:complete len:379 (+),score=43.70 GHVS01045050.1:132-1268(+)
MPAVTEQQRESLAPAPSGSCFICLEDGGLKSLVPCCSQCYAVVHKNCWRDWRLSQRLASVRSRLLGQNLPNPLTCSICRTGSAGVAGMEDGRSWTAHNDPVQERLQEELLQTIGRMLSDDEDDEDEPSICNAALTCANFFVFCCIVLVDVVLLSTGLVNGKDARSQMYPAAVVLLSMFVMYELVVLQLVVLAIMQRRNALGSLIDPPRRASSAPESNPNSSPSSPPVSQEEPQSPGHGRRSSLEGGGPDFVIDVDTLSRSSGGTVGTGTHATGVNAAGNTTSLPNSTSVGGNSNGDASSRRNSHRSSARTTNGAEGGQNRRGSRTSSGRGSIQLAARSPAEPSVTPLGGGWHVSRQDAVWVGMHRDGIIDGALRTPFL